MIDLSLIWVGLHVLAYIISMFIILWSISLISKIDEDQKVKLTLKGSLFTALWCGLYVISCLLFAQRYSFWFIILMVYVTIVSYTDIQCKMIWAVFSYIASLISIINIVVRVSLGEISLFVALSQIISITIIVVILCVFKAFGTGDLRMLYVTYTWTIWPFGELNPMYSLIALLVSMVACVIIHLPIFKKTKLKEKIAFAPYIALSTLLLVYVVGI